MDTQPQDDLHLSLLEDPSLSRRRFLRGAALAGGGLIAAGLAACAPAAAPAGRSGPGSPPPLPSASPSAPASAAPCGPSAGHVDGAERRAVRVAFEPDRRPSRPAGPSTTSRARNVVRRYLGDLVKALPGRLPAGRRRQAGR